MVVGYLDPATPPTTQDITWCSLKLNYYIKYLQTKGLPLWMWRDLEIPMVVNQSSYTIGGTGNIVTDRPLRVTSAFIRDSLGNDTSLVTLTRQEYDILGSKTTPGVPNQFYYDPQLPNGILNVYGVPTDNTYTIHAQVQVPIATLNSASDIPEFPNEWYYLLETGLADAIALQYQAPANVRQELAVRSRTLLNEMLDWSQEWASVYMSPDAQFMPGG